MEFKCNDIRLHFAKQIFQTPAILLSESGILRAFFQTDFKTPQFILLVRFQGLIISKDIQINIGLQSNQILWK